MFVLTDPILSGRSAGRPDPGRPLQRLHFDRIAQGRAGSVGLEVVDVARLHAGSLQSLTDHRLLRQLVRRREATASAVLVHGRPSDEREESIAVRERVRQPLEDHDSAALAANVSIGVSVERLAAAVGRHHARA